MGITGLLPFLGDASRPCHVSEFRGCSVAIDTYCWLHKGIFGCAEKLVRGEDTNGYVLYCLKYIKMLISYEIKPILVFDGQHLPAKKLTEDKRREQRKQSRKVATELLRLGKADEARAHMKSSLDVTHKMAFGLIKECRKIGVDCIVAPYEADAQLAYLHINKFVHFIITEDSDLLLFGCDKILFKMNVQGQGTLVEAQKINSCMKLRPDNYTFDKFRYMCILSGCDYLDSIPGVGLKKALKFVSVTENPSIYNVLLKLPSYLNLTHVVGLEEYRESFMIADATFKHQLVFDPIERKLLPLNDPKISGTEEKYCKNAGDPYDEAFALQMAFGNIDPFSHEVYDNWSPEQSMVSRTSIWYLHYRKPMEPVKKVPKLAGPSTRSRKTVTATEQEKLEYDINLEEDFKMYTTMEHTPKKQKIDVADSNSPPLSRQNYTPFMTLKNLSKFGRTVLTRDEPLTSRFFSSKCAPAVEPSTSHCDSLLSNIDDYATKQKMTYTQNQLCAQEIDEESGDNPNYIDENSVGTDDAGERRFSKYDIPKKACLSKTQFDMERQNSLESTDSNIEMKEVENDQNIVNISDDVEEEPINIDSADAPMLENTIKTVPVIPTAIVKKKSFSVRRFELFKKMCLKLDDSEEEPEKLDSTVINSEQTKSNIEENDTGSSNIEHVEPNIEESASDISQSPILSGPKRMCYRTLCRKKPPAKQLNLQTMFNNMRKD